MVWVVKLMPSHCGVAVSPTAITADWSRGLVGLLSAGGMVAERDTDEFILIAFVRRTHVKPWAWHDACTMQPGGYIYRESGR